jgi:hypothetical protein
MKCGFFLFTIICRASTSLFSQAEIPPAFNQQMMHSTQDKLENVAGSQYLSEEFNHGVIYYDGKHKVEQLPVRLNIYNDQLEFKSKEGVMAFGNPNRIDSVVIEHQVLIFIRKHRDYKLSGFVKKLNSGSPSILAKMKVEFFKGEDPKPFDLGEPKPDRLERIDDWYYLMKSDRYFQRVKSVKKLIRYLGKHSSELTKYAREEGVSMNDPEGLAKLINYYHQLER